MNHNKIVLLGREGVGKTCLVHRFKYNEFCESLPPTVGASFMSYVVEDDGGRTIVLGIWDTAGQERFNSILPLYIRHASLILLCIEDDISDIQKYTELKDDFSQTAKIFLVVTKCEEEKPENFYEDLENYEIYKTSAKTGEGVDKLFEDVKQFYVNKGVTYATETISLTKSNKLCCWR